MQDNYTVRYLPIAEADLLDIYNHIANEYPDKAAEFADKLLSRVLRDPR